MRLADLQQSVRGLLLGTVTLKLETPQIDHL